MRTSGASNESQLVVAVAFVALAVVIVLAGGPSQFMITCELARTVFAPEHEEFRGMVRKFFEREILPHREEWEAAGQISREAWLKAGS